MNTITVKPLSYEAFSKYGSFRNIAKPEGESLGAAPSEFFRDLVQLRLGHTNVLSMSSLELSKRPMVIDALEYHNHCGEAMLPLDSDIIVQVAPATAKGKIPYEKIEAFYVPQYTVVVLNLGIWHESPFLVDKERGHIFCMLPERTYENDTFVAKFPENKKIEIIFEK